MVGDAAHDDVAAMLLAGDADPGMPGRIALPERQQVAQDRLQGVDGHEHVARRIDALARGVGHLQRADAHQLAVRIDQRRPGEIRMQRRREQSVAQQILPIAGELAPAGQLGLAAAELAVAAEHQQRVADLDRAAAAERDRRRCRAAWSRAPGRSRFRDRSRQCRPGCACRRHRRRRPRWPRESDSRS